MERDATAALQQAAAKAAQAAETASLASAQLGAAAAYAGDAARQLAAAAETVRRCALEFPAAESTELSAQESERDLGEGLAEGAEEFAGLASESADEETEESAERSAGESEGDLRGEGRADGASAERADKSADDDAEKTHVIAWRVSARREDARARRKDDWCNQIGVLPPYWVTPSEGAAVHVYLPSRWSHEKGEQLAKIFAGNTGIQRGQALQDGRVPAILFFDAGCAARAALRKLRMMGEEYGPNIYGASGYVVCVSQLPSEWFRAEVSDWLRAALASNEQPDDIHLHMDKFGRRKALLCFYELVFAQNAQHVLHLRELPRQESAEAAFWTPPCYDPRTSDARCIPPPPPNGEQQPQLPRGERLQEQG